MGGIFGRMRGSRENIEIPIPSYSSEADFLQNLPSSVQVTFGVNKYWVKEWSMGFFIQDDFKVSRRLVLNMGVRWDYFSVPDEKDERLFNRDDPYGMGPYLPPDQIWKAKYANFSPRIGFAYTVDEKGRTVLRAGFGAFYNPRPLFGGPVDLVQNALDEPFRVVYSRADVLKYPDLLTYPVVNDEVLTIAKGPQALISGTGINPDWGYPHSYQWTGSIQQQLTTDFVLETSYVGTRGVGLMFVRSMNQPDRLTGVRPNSKFATFRYRNGDESTSYHAWQTSVRRRFRGGFAGNVNYVWSKVLSYTGDADLLLPATPQDVWNVRNDYGPAGYDAKHRLVTDILYELPFAKWTQSGGRATKLLLDGWQLSGIFYAQSGNPATITQPSSLESSRPDYKSGEEVILSNWSSSLRYLNPAAFTRVPISSVSGLPVRPGSVGRASIYGPGFWSVDLSIAKATAITEGVKLQFRFDMFNAFNHTNFSGFQTDVTRGNFGVFTSTRGARTVQIGLRLSF
jgi:hypothetical protein